MARRLHADGCVLVVIDVQDGFLRKLPEDEASAVVDRIRWLCRLADWLPVPAVVTEEEPELNGETASPIRGAPREAEGPARSSASRARRVCTQESSNR